MDENLSLGRMQITDDLNQLLAVLPESIRTTLEQHPKLDVLVEVVMDLGRYPEARFRVAYCDFEVQGSSESHCAR